jgi:hypothetical protein
MRRFGTRHFRECSALRFDAVHQLFPRFGEGGRAFALELLGERRGVHSNPLEFGEHGLCIAAYEQLTAEGIKARVISMPSWELFEGEDQEYRDAVLPPEIIARVAVEEASAFGWERYAGRDGAIIGLNTFGLSAPTRVVAQHFGFSPAHVVAAAREQISRHGPKK